MAGLCAPLSTLRQYPHGHLRMTRGRCGSLLLHRDGLAPSTPCRSPGALRSTPGPCGNADCGGDLRLDRLISEITDPVERRAKLGSLGFEGSDLVFERVVLALGINTKRGKFTATRLQPGLQFRAFAVKGETKLG